VTPVKPPATPVKAEIQGTVINSAGAPLASLPISIDATTSPRGSLYGETTFTTTTDRNGHFAIAQDPAGIDALSWSATAAFPWYAGAWQRNLTTVNQSNPTDLTFRSDLTSGGLGYGNSTTDGGILRLGDWDGCSQLPGNTQYPATDPSTTSLTVTLTPAGSLVDGSTGMTYTATVAGDILCIFNDDAVTDIPAGAWDVTAVTNTGRQLAFASTQEGPATTRAVIFNAPQSQSSPLAQLWISFADPSGS
jgi:hypothetical protein